MFHWKERTNKQNISKVPIDKATFAPCAMATSEREKESHQFNIFKNKTKNVTGKQKQTEHKLAKTKVKTRQKFIPNRLDTKTKTQKRISKSIHNKQTTTTTHTHMP